MTIHITGSAATDRAERYARQFADHLGHTIPVTADQDGYRLDHRGVHGSLTCDAEALNVSIEAPDEERLRIAMDSVQRHLERFGAREGLTIHWGQPDSRL